MKGEDGEVDTGEMGDLRLPDFILCDIVYLPLHSRDFCLLLPILK